MTLSRPRRRRRPVRCDGSPGARVADRKYLLERVDDAAVVQLYADGFDKLPAEEKLLIWHLYQAALAGRDIYYDQRYAHNLEMRTVLEEILTHPAGIDPATLAEIQRYTKLFWLNTGPYNNLTARKFVLKCTPDAFAAAARTAVKNGARISGQGGESLDAMLARLQPVFFDAAVDPIVTNKTPGPGKDILSSSANNLYVGVTMKDLDGFDEQHRLNSRLVKQNGRLVEEVYKVGGKYDAQIRQIVGHLEAAIPYAPAAMPGALRALIKFYQTGETADRVAYDIAWVEDKDSPVDTINGFIEVYMDARGMKGSWESLVFYVNQEKTEGIRKLAADAQWFEDRMPWAAQYRKQGVRGITANAIDVVVETGDSGPITPVGINLPNDQDVREQHGSKSVSLSNVNEAYDRSTSPEFRREFSWTPEEAARAEKWSSLACELTTNMHEVIGHASGKIAERLKGNPSAALKEQYSALEEARADLVALYFLPNPKLAELGLVTAAGPGGDRPGRIRGLHAQRAGAAAPRARRHADRGRPHAQPADDRPVADVELEGDRRARARRQDLLRDGRREGVPGWRRPAARGGPAHQVGRGLRGGEEAVRDLRRALRCEAARRDRRPRRPSQDAVLHRLRPAEADAGHRRRRQGHGREDFVSDGSDDADARILRAEEVGRAQAGCGRGGAVAVVVMLAGLHAAPGAAGGAQPTAISAPGLIGVLAVEDARAPLPEDLRALLAAARSGNAAVQRAAVRALGRLERRDVVTDLLPYLQARDPQVADEAASALALALRGPALRGAPPTSSRRPFWTRCRRAGRVTRRIARPGASRTPNAEQARQAERSPAHRV